MPKLDPHLMQAFRVAPLHGWQSANELVQAGRLFHSRSFCESRLAREPRRPSGCPKLRSAPT
jgi:hypothetical protein